MKPSVTHVNRIEIGFRSAGDCAAASQPRRSAEEALMLTGDENIVDINFTVFWLIKDAQAYPVQHPRPRGDRQGRGRERDARGRRPDADRRRR